MLSPLAWFKSSWQLPQPPLCPGARVQQILMFYSLWCFILIKQKKTRNNRTWQNATSTICALSCPGPSRPEKFSQPRCKGIIEKKKKRLLTLSDVSNKAIPSGMNAIPKAKKAGSTVPTVIMGCHAGSFCCLNLVSENIKITLYQSNLMIIASKQKLKGQVHGSSMSLLD